MITILEPLKNFPNFYASSDGHILKDCYKSPLKYFIKEDGYSRVKLINQDGKGVNKFVHKLVASVFVKKPTLIERVKYVLTHKNWDRSDNRPENLEWVENLAKNSVKCVAKRLCNDIECAVCYKKSFASSDKVKYWSNLNSKTPREILTGSGKKYKFDCYCGHTFETTPHSVVYKNSWCLYCCRSPRKLCDDIDCNNCYEKSFASSDKSKYWSTDNTISPREIFKCSGKKYKFVCDVCEHTFEISPNNLNIGHWCHYCTNQKICENNNCDMCYQKSFASSEKAIYWSKENNNTPRNIFMSSHADCMFDCICGHSFKIKPSHVKAGHWCHYCSHQKLCDDETCMSCYKRSFASSDKARYWSKENTKQPRKVFISTRDKYAFDCDCGHTFKSSIDTIKTGSWCPYCSKTSHKLCQDINCQSCYQNSFASSDKIKMWSKENTVNPREITKFTTGKYKFDWECGHQTIESIYGLRKIGKCRKCDSCPSCQLWLTKGKLCEYCKPKSQNKLYRKTKEMEVVKFLKDKLPDKDFIHNKSVSSECTGTHLFPDILLDCNSYNLIVEVDEHKHRGASYDCDEKRMYDIIAKLGLPCIFIRYNPDDKKSDKLELLNRVKYYLDLNQDIDSLKEWNEFGFKAEYLFY